MKSLLIVLLLCLLNAGNCRHLGHNGDEISITTLIVVSSTTILLLLIVILKCTGCFGYKIFHNSNDESVELHDQTQDVSHQNDDKNCNQPTLSSDNNLAVLQIEPVHIINITPSHALPTPVSACNSLCYLPNTDTHSSELLQECADWFYYYAGFPRDKLQLLREIGGGWFGRIALGELQGSRDSDASLVSVKILNNSVSERDKRQFLNECKLFRDVHHPNVLRLCGYNLNEEPWMLIFDYYLMDMKHYLLSNREKKALLHAVDIPLRLMVEVASALSYIHSKGFVHGDVSCRCVGIRFINDTPQAVVSGLGDAAGRYPSDYCHGIPLRWAAPEQLLRAPYMVSVESDAWSLGVLLWEACHWGERPFDELSDESVAEGLRAHLNTDSDTGPLYLSTPDPITPYRDHMFETMCACWCGRGVRANVSWICERLRNAPSAPQVEPAPPEGELLTALSPLDKLLDAQDSDLTVHIVKSPAIEDFQNLDTQILSEPDNVKNLFENTNVEKHESISNSLPNLNADLHDCESVLSHLSRSQGLIFEKGNNISDSKLSSSKCVEVKQCHENAEQYEAETDSYEKWSKQNHSQNEEDDGREINLVALRNELMLKLPLAQQSNESENIKRCDISVGLYLGSPLSTVLEEEIDDGSESLIDSSAVNHTTVISTPHAQKLKHSEPCHENANAVKKDTKESINNDNHTESEQVTITSPCLAYETLPTKHLNQKETHVVSRSTSLNSWCSNDTLFNVDDNFDDAFSHDPEKPIDTQKMLAIKTTVKLAINDEIIDLDDDDALINDESLTKEPDGNISLGLNEHTYNTENSNQGKNVNEDDPLDEKSRIEVIRNGIKSENKQANMFETPTKVSGQLVLSGDKITQPIILYKSKPVPKSKNSCEFSEKDGLQIQAINVSKRLKNDISFNGLIEPAALLNTTVCSTLTDSNLASKFCSAEETLSPKTSNISQNSAHDVSSNNSNVIFFKELPISYPEIDSKEESNLGSKRENTTEQHMENNEAFNDFAHQKIYFNNLDGISNKSNSLVDLVEDKLTEKNINEESLILNELNAINELKDLNNRKTDDTLDNNNSLVPVLVSSNESTKTDAPSTDSILGVKCDYDETVLKTNSLSMPSENSEQLSNEHGVLESGRNLHVNRHIEEILIENVKNHITSSNNKSASLLNVDQTEPKYNNEDVLYGNIKMLSADSQNSNNRLSGSNDVESQVKPSLECKQFGLENVQFTFENETLADQSDLNIFDCRSHPNQLKTQSVRDDSNTSICYVKDKSKGESSPQLGESATVLDESPLDLTYTLKDENDYEENSGVRDDSNTSISYVQDKSKGESSPQLGESATVLEESPLDLTYTVKDENDYEENSGGTSSSEDFIWKDGDDGVCITLTTSTDFAQDCQQIYDVARLTPTEDVSSSDSDEEWVPSSWDRAAAPSKSSIRRNPQGKKKKVMFKRQTCSYVYQYPRETSDFNCEILPQQPFEKEYPGFYCDDELYISAAARPLQSSEFHPAKLFHGHVTPDSGIDDLTPATTNDACNFPLDLSQASSPIANSAGESSTNVGSATLSSELGGLRHTRNKLTLQLQPSSPKPPTPLRNNTFNYDFDSAEEDSGIESANSVKAIPPPT